MRYSNKGLNQKQSDRELIVIDENLYCIDLLLYMAKADLIRCC
jgi:hypothetical protein